MYRDHTVGWTCLSQEGQNKKTIKTNMESLYLFITDDHTDKCAGTAFCRKQC